MNKIKVATWNVGSVYENNSDNSLVLEDFLTKYNPDVLAVQELPDSGELINKIKTVLNASYHYYQVCSPSHIAKRYDMGICIFSKFPIEFVDKIQLDNLSENTFVVNGKIEKLHRKYFICCKIFVEESEMLVVTGHGYPTHRYNISSEVFKPSFYQLDEWISLLKNKGDSLTLACDFNIPNPLDYMPKLATDHVDPFVFVGTRPSGRKTDSVIVEKYKKIYETVSVSTNLDHNFVLLTLEV